MSETWAPTQTRQDGDTTWQVRSGIVRREGGRHVMPALILIPSRFGE